MQPNADDALLPQHQQPEDASSPEKQPVYIVIMEKRDIVPLKLQSKGHRMASWPLMTRPWKAKKSSHRFVASKAKPRRGHTCFRRSPLVLSIVCTAEHTAEEVLRGREHSVRRRQRI